MELISLSYLVEEVISEFIRRHPSLRANFEIENHVLVKGNYDELKGVIRNLVGGAIRCTEKTTNATIIFGQVENEQIYFVMDNGNGFKMRPQKVNDNFFFHTSFGHKSSELSKVKRMMIKRGGRVWGNSQETTATVFHFSLN